MAPAWSCSFFLNILVRTLLLTLLLLVPIHDLSVHASSSVVPLSSCREDGRSALLAFKQSLHSSEFCYWGPIYSEQISFQEILGFGLVTDAPPPCSVGDYDQKLESWDEEATGSNCCEWEGVECDNNNNGQVIGLDLSNIPCLCASTFDSVITTLSRLVHLQKLNLANVNFNITTIPSALANLTQLRLLNLSGCYLEGRIPSQIFLNLTNLSSLDLSSNYDLKLTDASFQALSRSLRELESLNLALVDTISAPVPDALANLSSLTTLVISDCHLQGQFPTAIFGLPKLEYLEIADNPNLSGHLLPTFNFSTSLDVLKLSFTNFSGEISNDLVKNLLRSLSVFRISGCNFHGELPSSLSNLTKLSTLYLADNRFHGRVPSFVNCAQLSRLRMEGNMLTGNIPPSLGNLTHLSLLELSSNQLTGPIPDSLMNLKEGLAHLDLTDNKLTGRIPSRLGNLTRLEFLQLHNNRFDGPVPSTISQLTDLHVLFLGHNFLNGTLRFDDVFSQLQNLRYLDLSFNWLSVVFDPSRQNNKNKFFSLGLASCDLNEFPPFLGGQDQLQWLDLSGNNICGQVPKWFTEMNSRNFMSLNLSSNSLVGFSQNPADSNWTSLETLDLRFNEFQGSLPIPPRTIEYYLVSDNRLSGEMPWQVCSLTDIQVLDLSKNNFTGAVPQCLSNLTDTLRILSLHDNNFGGTIPDHELGKRRGITCALRMIDVSNNRLQGPIPRSLSNCTELKFLNFGKNRIVDTFPSWLGSLGELRVLILRSNRFHGAIGDPQNDTEFPNLQIIDLSQNEFGGSLPSKYFNCWNITKGLSLDRSANYLGESMIPSFYAEYTICNGGYDYSMTIMNKGMEMEYAKILDYFTAVDLSCNNFSGEIPNSIGSLDGLHLLNLSNNVLTCYIPPILKDLTQLEALDLSSNKLSGQIPQELTQLTSLEFFDVSSNQLSGPIPRGPQFNTFVNSSYKGNSRLCGFPLTKECGNHDPRAPPSQDHEEEHSESDDFEVELEVIAIGFASGLVVGAVMGLVVPIRRNHLLVRMIGKIVRRTGGACW